MSMASSGKRQRFSELDYGQAERLKTRWYLKPRDV